MSNPYAATSSGGSAEFVPPTHHDDIDDAEEPTLPPGVQIQPLGLRQRPLSLRVPTKVKINELPVPQVLRTPRTAAQVRLYERNEEVRKMVNVNLDEMPDRLMRIAAAMKPVPPEYEPTMPLGMEERPPFAHPQVDWQYVALVGVVGLAVGFLVYGALKNAGHAVAATSSPAAAYLAPATAISPAVPL